MLGKGWLEASTVILMSMQGRPYISPYNFKMLMLKRSGKSSFMPNGYVFPGGTVEPVDSHLDWIDVFKSNGVSESSIESVLIDQKKLPCMFDSSKDISQLSKQLVLRITAIREAFEEAGVLLCRSSPCNNSVEWGESIITPELKEWRKKVQQEPINFLTMCRELKIFPDIWGLKLWSNWLTPPDVKKRFDTSFYTVCLDQQPETCADGTEIEKLAWSSPIEMMAANARKKLWLPPPQMYEISRILPFCMLEDLAAFANERERKGVERFGGGPRLKTKDGLVYLLPGDELLSETDPDKYADLTFKQLRSRSQTVHRLEIFKENNIENCKVVALNLQPTLGHILPYTEFSPA